MSEPEAPADSSGGDVGGPDSARPDADPGDATDADDGVPDGIDPLVEAGMVFVTTTTVGLQVEDPYPVLGEISACAEAHGGGRVHRSFTAATEYQGAHGLITVNLPPRELCTAPMPPRRRSRSRRSRAPPQGPGPSSPPPAPPGGRSPATGSRPPDPPITGAGPSRAGNPIKEPEGHGRDANRGRFGPEWVTIRKPLPEVVISP